MMIDILGEETYKEIEDHLRTRGNRAHIDGWDSGCDEEDTLTGDFGGQLRGTFGNWKVTYKKFRGRGPGALEKKIGADGIFVIEKKDNKGNVIFSKGMLFQAKKGRAYNSTLRKQVENMENIQSGCSAVFEYGPEGYRGYNSESYLNDNYQKGRIGDFLADDFLACNTGKRNFYYDAIRKRVVIDSTHFYCPVENKILIEVC